MNKVDKKMNKLREEKHKGSPYVLYVKSFKENLKDEPRTLCASCEPENDAAQYTDDACHYFQHILTSGLFQCSLELRTGHFNR